MGDERPLRWYHSPGNPPARDLAREETLLERAGDGPFLLTWSWEMPVLVLGFGQSIEDVDFGFCRRERVAVFRRCSGGTGVIHRGDLSASLVLPAGHSWAQGIRPLYDRFVSIFGNILAEAGIPTLRPEPSPQRIGPRSPICFEDRLAETLLASGRKVLGCAQARRCAGVLVHGTLLLRENSSLCAGVFRVPEERVRCALGPVPGWALRPEVLARRVAERFAEGLGAALAASPLPEEAEREASALCSGLGSSDSCP